MLRTPTIKAIERLAFFEAAVVVYEALRKLSEKEWRVRLDEITQIRSLIREKNNNQGFLGELDQQRFLDELEIQLLVKQYC